MNKIIVIGCILMFLVVAMAFSAACILPEQDKILKEKYADQMEATLSLADSMTIVQLSYMDLIKSRAALIASDPQNISQTSHLLAEIYSFTPSLNGIAFANETGYVTTAFPLSLQDLLVGNRVDNAELYNATTSVSFDIFKTKERPIPGVVVPCVSDAGKTCGYIIATVDMSSYLGTISTEYPNASNWRYWLITNGGFILYSQYPDMSGNHMSNLNTPDRAGLYRVFEQALEDTSGIAVYTGYSYIDLKPMDFVATWDTIPVDHTGDQKILVLITAKQGSRVPDISTVPSTDQTLEEFVHSAWAFSKDAGKEAALAEFSNPNGLFTTKEYSIFAFDRNKTLLSDAYDREFIGRPISYYVDSNGVEAGDLICKRAMQGGGYVAYLYPNPARNMTEQLKLSYIVQVDDDWYIAAGDFNDHPGLHIPVDVRESLTSYLRSVQLYAQSVDKNEALKTLNDPSGPYAPPKDMRFFAMDYNGTILADPQYPRYVGKNYLGMTDIFGSSISRDAVILAKEGGGKQYVYTPKEANMATYDLRMEYILPAGDDWLILGAVTMK